MLPKIISLFSGAGGLDLGYHDAGFSVIFAVDNSPSAIKTHKRNFPNTTSITADLAELRPKGVLRQVESLLSLGDPIGVIGGPPCQGFSRANNAAATNDPRNKLPLLYLAIVASLQKRYDVQFVLFENVQGIRDAKHSVVFEGILSKFSKMGLHAGVEEYSALDFGVAQTRNRVIISGFSSPSAAAAFAPVKVPRKDLTVRAVIGHLPRATYFSRELNPEDISHHPNHWTMRPASKRFTEPHRLNQSGRSFRQLAWDKPSPTVAYGHREIHVHPNGTRRLSIYEAMLLQGFPSNFVLEGSLSAQVEQISNAVPPPLARALADATKKVFATKKSRSKSAK